MQHDTNNDKKIFVALGPSQPHSVPPRRIEKYYKERKEVGSFIVHQTRFWVSYSTVLDKVFCTTCLLFGSKDDSNSLRDGFNNWDNLSHAINKHITRRNHRIACETYIAVMCDKTVDVELDKQKLEIVNKRKNDARILHNYLEIIIDCFCDI